LQLKGARWLFYNKISEVIMSEAVGVCQEVDPVTALVLLGLDGLIKEFNSKEPFGPNNEIVKALKTAWNDRVATPGRFF